MLNPAEALMLQSETPENPWRLIQIDIFTWGGIKYLTIVGRFSKVAVAKVLLSKSAVTVHEALLEIRFVWVPGEDNS